MKERHLQKIQDLPFGCSVILAKTHKKHLKAKKANVSHYLSCSVQNIFYTEAFFATKLESKSVCWKTAIYFLSSKISGYSPPQNLKIWKSFSCQVIPEYLLYIWYNTAMLVRKTQILLKTWIVGKTILQQLKSEKMFLQSKAIESSINSAAKCLAQSITLQRIHKGKKSTLKFTLAGSQIHPSISLHFSAFLDCNLNKRVFQTLKCVSKLNDHSPSHTYTVEINKTKTCQVARERQILKLPLLQR